MVISSNRVFIRKEHVCFGCAIKFPINTDMFTTVDVADGHIDRNYWCITCNAFLKLNHKDFEEGVNFGEFRGEDVYEEFKLKLNERNLEEARNLKKIL